MNVLSLFDGISGAQLAIRRAGIDYYTYFASEIDKWAIHITQRNFPYTVQLGDVTKINGQELPEIGLLIGGSPCQGFSLAGGRLNFNDARSKLFFEFVRILEECRTKNPNIKFILENVPMKREWRDTISEYLGIEPMLIQSSLVSAQSRKRLYWTNIEVTSEPLDREIELPLILEDESIAENYLLSKKEYDYMNKTVADGRNHWNFGHYSDSRKRKSSTVVANFCKGVPYNVLYDARLRGYRKFTPIECERLQTYPDNYTEGISNTQRYKALGNSFTVEVIAHILSFME